jgi:hypothetical protein
MMAAQSVDCAAYDIGRQRGGGGCASALMLKAYLQPRGPITTVKQLFHKTVLFLNDDTQSPQQRSVTSRQELLHLGEEPLVLGAAFAMTAGFSFEFLKQFALAACEMQGGLDLGLDHHVTTGSAAQD